MAGLKIQFVEISQHKQDYRSEKHDADAYLVSVMRCFVEKELNGFVHVFSFGNMGKVWLVHGWKGGKSTATHGFTIFILFYLSNHEKVAIFAERTVCR